MATERMRTSPTPTTHRSANNVVTARAKGRARLRRRVVLAGLLGMCAWPLLAWAAAQLLIVKSDLPIADAIVVLSGSSTYIERADWAARLYRDGRAPLVILTDDKLISGWNGADERNPYFYELAAKELQIRGVPAERIRVVAEPAVGTYYESLNVREYATSHKLERLLIVTSAYHSRRALWAMRRACKGTGIEISVDGPSPGWQTPSAWTWWLHRWGWRVVAGEYVKLIYYWWQY
ncbi:MAG: hypothetical protein DMF70_07915 [Acidobacteria bacterium]|nr:MAG: hypothetical protein DMF70_07915 [Acidobacteriota bacterium]